MLKVAVIGLGWWGRIIVDVLSRSDRLQVVRVVDIGEAGRAFAAERGLPFSMRYEEALADPAVQGVVLCTPHTLHTDQIVAAAQAGKHVFCEKPLSMTRADVLRASAAVDRAGVTLAVGHEKRFEPPILELMRLLQSGALGTPLQVEAMDRFDQMLQHHELCYHMRLEPGDIQLLNNHVVLHSRTHYVDFPDPAAKRHLLRLWLSSYQGVALPDNWKDAYKNVAPRSVRGGFRGTQITDEIRAYIRRLADETQMEHNSP